MIPRRVRLAVLIAFIFHGLFILSGRYRLSYDAYTHMLFANHYAENWFSLWESRWYTGFTVASYPPLTHQLIALFVPFLGVDKAFALLLWTVTTIYPLGIYAFSRIFTGRTSASYASLAAAVLAPIYVTAHIFGQLPFLTSTLAALFAAASLNRYLREGGLHNLALSTALITTSMAMHHATLMVQPFLIFAVAANQLFREKYSLEHTWVLLYRLLLFSLASTTASLVVIFPFWQWGATQALQKPIDHLSRHNFFADPLALSIFFLPFYGLLVLLIPFLFQRWPRRFIGLLISFTILFLFGLGGTTPLPGILLGNAWEWLTYDRFAFWACLALTPFFGIFFIRLKRSWRNWFSAGPVQTRIRIRGSTVFDGKTIFNHKGHEGKYPSSVLLFPLCVRRALSWHRPHTPHSMFVRGRWQVWGEAFSRLTRESRKSFLTSLVFFILAFTALGSWLTPLLWPFQPESIEMQPVVDFLNEGSNSRWRYLTFGFGDQFAYLNLLTRATTIDGSYHTARSLPELRESGIGQVDTAYWATNGMAAIKPILQKSGEHSVRWGFVNPETREAVKIRWGRTYRSPFIPLLNELGWVKIQILENGILVYENPKARPLALNPDPVFPPLTSFAWGVFPVLAFAGASALGALRLYPLQAEWTIRKIFSFAIGLLPLALCFWVYRTVGEFSHPRVYFTYDNALFFLSDAIVVLAVILWLAVKISNGPYKISKSQIIFFFLIVLLTTTAVLWSRDWRTSLYISLHFWLVLLLVLSLWDWHEAWPVAMAGLCCALSFELIAGFAGFGLQSTSFLEPMNLKWPGTLTPSVPGTSVVQMANGLRILRAYGTLPHPNILGGLVLITLLGPASLFFLNKKFNYPALFLFSLGIILLILTFSRSAWLGLIAFAAVLTMKSKYFERRRLVLLLSTVLVTMTFTLYPLRDLVLTRVSNQEVATEQISTVGRRWLDQQAVRIFQTSPLIGAGAGSFILELADSAPAGAPIEPVHNLLLLIPAELGLVGLVLILGLCTFIALNIYHSDSPQAILAGAVIAGMGVIGLFDHYLWTLAPGRIMLGLVLGLWAGQAANHG